MDNKTDLPNRTTYSKILDLIYDYNQTSDKLPSEDIIAKQLNISRVKVRDTMAVIEANGYIIRRRGVGTLINKYALAEKARFDIDNYFDDMITKLGYKATDQLIQVSLCTDPPADLYSRLNLEEGTPVFRVVKTILADNTPAIYICDYVPSKYFDINNIDLKLITENIFNYVQTRNDLILHSMIATLDAITIEDNDLSECMKLPVGFPLLKAVEISYTQTIQPVIYSLEYYNTKIIPFSIYKRIVTAASPYTGAKQKV